MPNYLFSVTTPPAKAGGFKCRLRRLRSVRALEC